MPKLRNQVLIFLKGIAMGAADAIPGVSGGTIALITGIYQELIHTLKSVDLQALRLLQKLELAKLWKYLNLNFLLPLLVGIGISLISLAKIIVYLLENQPIPLWSFFFGLIIISSVIVLRNIKAWSLISVLSLLAGIAFAFWITIITPATTPNEYWFVFISGTLAICAMILPGISGAFVLLILGKYQYIYQSLIEMNISVILVFVAGCAVGILSFSHFVSWLLSKFYAPSIAMLSGFMIGSLNKIWPWKIITLYQESGSGNRIPIVQENVLPGKFLSLTGQEPQILFAVLFMALGILLVIGIEKLSYPAKS